MPKKPAAPGKRPSIKQLREENEKLRNICRSLQWMARRYADGRSSYVPGMVNDCTKELIEMGVLPVPGGEHKIFAKADVRRDYDELIADQDPGADGLVWARDGGGRMFDGLSDEQITPGHHVALGKHLVPQRMHLHDEVVELLRLDGSRDFFAAVTEIRRLLAKCGELPDGPDVQTSSPSRPSKKRVRKKTAKKDGSNV